MSIDPFLSVDLTESEGEVEPRKGPSSSITKAVSMPLTPPNWERSGSRGSHPPRKIVSRAERLTRV